MKEKKGRPQFVPTLEQIKEECEKIRAEWTPEKWRNQIGAVPWKVPLGRNPDVTSNQTDSFQ